jgi:hypothetical protein
MLESDRVKLLGQYRTPRFRYGDVVTCAMRGDMKVVGLSNARIPWPKGRTGKRSRALILYGALAQAVRRESVCAVAYWFGIARFTVWQWRKALGVDRRTPGTSALRSRWAPETVQSTKAHRRREAAQISPQRAAKIAASLRGRPRPVHVIEALVKANKGRKLPTEQRRKMSAAHKRNGRHPGMSWTAEELAILGTMKDRDAAERMGRKPSAVAAMRERVGVAAYVKRASRGKPYTWTLAKDRLLGTMSDVDLARRLRCSPMTVFYRRRRLKIGRFTA